MCQDRVFASFLCVLSLSSVLGSFIHMYCDTGLTRRSYPAWDVKPLLFSHIPNIFAVNILLKTRRIYSLTTFCKLLLSDIKTKTLINLRHFLIFFLDVPSLWLGPVFLGCIWVVFWPKIPKMLSIVFEILTSYDMKDDASDMLQFLLKY